MSLYDRHLIDPPNREGAGPDDANVEEATQEVMDDADYLAEVLAESPKLAQYAFTLARTSQAFRLEVLAHAKERIELRAQQLADAEVERARDDYDDYRASALD